jgi:hypothetical protein
VGDGSSSIIGWQVASLTTRHQKLKEAVDEDEKARRSCGKNVRVCCVKLQEKRQKMQKK